MSKKSKLNNDETDTPQVILHGYKGHEYVPENVTHVRFHPSVEDFDSDAFEDRKQLREVILNDGLKEIADYAFMGCKALQSINIPSTVTNIGMNSFSSCSGLRDLVLNEGLLRIGEQALPIARSWKVLQFLQPFSTLNQKHLCNAVVYGRYY